VPRVDFITSPGYLDGPGAREKAGLPPGTGPWKVISTLAVMGFHPVTKCMQVESLHPGVSREDLISNTGFDIPFCESVTTTAEPTGQELEILRNEVDPSGRILGKMKNKETGK
jgi:glutaconate CoA-transferase subunit B